MAKIKLLTSQEVCEMFNISRNTLQRWVKARKIPYVYIAREYRFVEAALQKFIERRTTKAVA